MRPLRLDMAGFTVFRDETTVDFTDADYFALVGPTGSGKSTVLDAICFALYGTVPRWGGTRGIVNALAPSAAEARVRLVFESAGSRYVATRVVRRDGRGNVKTAGAGLQLMPSGFDATRLDTGMSPEDLGEVLAGTPAEMDQAVLEAVGLPYEQFTSCVVLPQGQFADFLHAKPATRQQILVNLLGLHVYEKVQALATTRATKADGQLEQVEQSLGGLADATDEAVAEAAARLDEMREFTLAVEAAVPGLREARDRELAAAAARDALDDELAALAAVRTPAGSAETAGAMAQARERVAEAVDAVRVAEEREDKIRGELAAAGDRSALSLLLERHAELDRLTADVKRHAEALTAAEATHRAEAAELARARSASAAADAGVERALEEYRTAERADQAVALRIHLAAGDDCPVCERRIDTLPPTPAGSAVERAVAAGKAARAAANAVREALEQREQALRTAERAADRHRAQHDQAAVRRNEIAAALADSPGVPALRRQVEELTALQRRLDDAGIALRAARTAQRQAQRAAAAAEERQRSAWRTFDTSRDAVARFGPPPADRDDLTGAWAALVGWAEGERQSRAERRVAADTAVAEAHRAVVAALEAVAVLFASAGVEVPGGSTPGREDADLIRAAAIAAERAESAWRRLADRREEAREYAERRAALQRDQRVAKSLAGHLRANNFERWLLAEALDLLVDGASRILLELTGGQYALSHDKGEFYVLDHHDAGLKRGVRTLSGGETFQASLALALALSEQLAGLSTTAASLESIVLDEGFGTLDATTLDVVAATLENLAARGDRMVGVVTHVHSLAERVPVRFEVRKDARTAHVERVGG